NFIRPHASLDLRSSYQPHPFRWYNVLINYSYPILAAPFAAGGDFDPLVLSAARTSQHPALSLQRTQRQEPALSAAEGRGHPFSDMAFGARKNGNLRLS